MAQVFHIDAAGNAASCRCAKGCLGIGRSGGVGHIAACTADPCHQATGKAGLCLRLGIVVIFHIDSDRFNGLCVQQSFHAALGVGLHHHDGGVIQAYSRAIVHLCLGNQPTQHLNVHIAFGPDGSVHDGCLGLGFHLRQGQGLCNAQQADVHIGTVAAAHRGRCAITRFIKPGNHADVAVGGHIRGCAFRANMGRMLCGDLGEHIVGCQFNTGNGNVGGQNLCIRCRRSLTQNRKTVSIGICAEGAVPLDSCAGYATSLCIGNVQVRCRHTDRDTVIRLFALGGCLGLIPIRQVQLPYTELLVLFQVQIRLGAAACIGVDHGDCAGIVADCAAGVDTGIRQGGGIGHDRQRTMNGSRNSADQCRMDCVEVCHTGVGRQVGIADTAGSSGACAHPGLCAHLGILVQVGYQGHVSGNGIQAAISYKGVLPHIVHGNGHVGRNGHNAKACRWGHDVGIGLGCSLGGNGDIAKDVQGAGAGEACVCGGRGTGYCRIEADICKFCVDTAGSGCNVGICQGGIGIGDGNILTGEGLLGIQNRLKGSGSEAVAHHHAYRYPAQAKVFDPGVGRRCGGIGNRHLSGLSAKACPGTAGTVRQGHGPVAGGCDHSGGSGIDAGLCHLGKSDRCGLVFIPLLLFRCQIFFTDRRQDGGNQHILLNRQIFGCIQPGLLLRTHPGECQRGTGGDTAQGRIDNQGMGLGTAIG